jgi:hypothetical protein
MIIHSGGTDTRHRDIITRDIGVLEVVKVGTSKVLKTLGNLNHPFEETHGGNRRPVGTSVIGVLS